MPFGVLALASLLSTGWAAATTFTATWHPAGPESGCSSAFLSILGSPDPTSSSVDSPSRASGPFVQGSIPTSLGFFRKPLHRLGFCHCLHSCVALSWPYTGGPSVVLSPVVFLGTRATVSCGLPSWASPASSVAAPAPPLLMLNVLDLPLGVCLCRCVALLSDPSQRPSESF